MTPSFGLVIPLYDREVLIAYALESAVRQGFDEIVVVDDGSADRGPEVAASFRGVKVVRQDNAGANAARNRGVESLSTDFVTFLDSDDELLPAFLETYRRAALAGADIITSGYLRTSRGDPSRCYQAPRELGPVFSGYQGSFFHGGTYAVRREVFWMVGGFDSQMRSGQHSEFALRLLRHARECDLDVQVIDEALCLYYAGAADGIRTRSAGAGAARMLEKHEDLLARDPRAASTYAALAGSYALRHGDRRAARKYFVRAVRYRPFEPMHWARLLHASLPTPVRRLVQERARDVRRRRERPAK